MGVKMFISLYESGHFCFQTCLYMCKLEKQAQPCTCSTETGDVK